MSNIIDKIRVSGTDYTLSATSSGGNPTIEVTQAEYDALVSAGTVQEDTYYIITDSSIDYINSAQCQSQIDSSISGKADTSAVTEAIDAAVSGKVSTNDFNAYSGSVDTTLNSKASQSDLNSLSGTVTGHTADTTIHVTSSDKTTWNGKQDALVSGTNIKTINNESILGSGNITIQSEVSSAITSGDTNAVAGGAVYDKFDEVEQVTAAALNTLNTNKQDKLSAGTGIEISGNVISATGGGGGNPTVELTQAEYDALVSAGTVSADTYYIITDATPVDMSNYYTTAQTNTLLAGKQDTLSAGTNITISGNVISASGGGKAIEAGRGISVTTGETAVTVSFNLPISAGTGADSVAECYNTKATGSYSHAEGSGTTASGIYGSHAEGFGTNASGRSSHAEGGYTKANGMYSHAEGYYAQANGSYSHAEGYYAQANGGYSHAEGYITTASTDYAHAEGGYTKASGNYSHAEGVTTTASGDYSHAEGRYTTAQNEAEHASGRYNVSRKANTTFGDSGNTLFSVGNGSDSEYRHNALDIRQNGDIYIVDTSASGDYFVKPMIKLQESLGGTVSSAITRGDTNAVAGGAVYDKFDEVEQVTAQALNVLNDRLDEDEEVTAAALNNLNEALSGKQDTLSAGTNITIVDNVISAQGGGQTYTAGDGIDITNSVISISLPISAGTGSNSIIEGHTGNTASGQYSHAEGGNTSATTMYAHTEGYGTKASGLYAHAEGGNASAITAYAHAEGNCTIATNRAEHASGQYNVSSSGSSTFGGSGNTLFSVGNGTSNLARHNAFEIRQNGDIYCSDGTNDIKLQDTITATALNTTALGGLKLVKLTQSAYDALSPNYDSNTLYIIVN